MYAVIINPIYIEVWNKLFDLCVEKKGLVRIAYRNIDICLAYMYNKCRHFLITKKKKSVILLTSFFIQLNILWISAVYI